MSSAANDFQMITYSVDNAALDDIQLITLDQISIADENEILLILYQKALHRK